VVDMHVRVGNELSEIGKILEELKKSSENVGAITIFVGVVRRESRGRNVNKLIYEAHKDLAEKFLGEIASYVKNKYGLIDVILEHKIGELSVGEETMIVGIASKHRAEGISALEETIERIKMGVPIWKKEVAEEGEFWIKDEYPSRLQILIDGKEARLENKKKIFSSLINLLGETLRTSPEKIRIRISITTYD